MGDNQAQHSSIWGVILDVIQTRFGSDIPENLTFMLDRGGEVRAVEPDTVPDHIECFTYQQVYMEDYRANDLEPHRYDN